MRVVTLNINGIRSGLKKGWLSWVAEHRPDIICLQETRIDESLLTDKRIQIPSYQFYICCAQKRGYAGVGIYVRSDLQHMPIYFEHLPFNDEGRVLAVDIGAVVIFSMYFPSGSSGEHRQIIKYNFLDMVNTLLKDWIDPRPIILCGDINIAHHKLDIKNWRSNQNRSGFLLQERQWLTAFLDQFGFIDVFRHMHPQTPGYTWWSTRQQAFNNNVGWRIDYQLISTVLKPNIQSVFVDRMACLSDHAPLVVDYAIESDV